MLLSSVQEARRLAVRVGDVHGASKVAIARHRHKLNQLRILSPSRSQESLASMAADAPADIADPEWVIVEWVDIDAEIAKQYPLIPLKRSRRSPASPK